MGDNVNDKKFVKYTSLIVVFLFICGLIFATIRLYQSANSRLNHNEIENQNKLDKIKESNRIKTLGRKDAKKDVVVFIDYRCEACHQFHKDYFKKIESLIKKNKIQYTEVAYSSIDDYSKDFTQLDIAASQILNQQQYMKFKELVYKETNKDQPQVKNVVDHFKFDTQTQIYNNYHKNKNAQLDLNQFGQKMHIKRTPTIFIDGQKITSSKQLKKELK